MKPSIAKEWITALRSGRYKQCQTTLKAEDAYCCLGVLTELYLKEHPHDTAMKEHLDIANYLHPVVMEWADIDHEMGRIKNRGLPDLAEYNDGVIDEGLSPHTFKQIADIIEKHIKDL